MVNNNDITNTKKNSLIDDTALHSGLWSYVVVISASATFTTLNDEALALGSYNGKTFLQNTQLPGKFTDIELSVGEVIAYA
ncbi:hypothetical protein [Pseudoalteromonas sp.]|uniref:hypothetical protein n=1 Tax=Pseudoalteromonas sp. TaxID=53249 RepID=UPI00261D5836|nr:hypothetical protein [Pseudoalteromonas sp.]MCP4585907.1 hypothetical protein [Pseudoalteromonas sp.]